VRRGGAEMPSLFWYNVFMGFDIGRLNDLETLNKALKNAPPGQVVRVQKTIHNILNESPIQKSMREALIRASRNGDLQEMKDIREYVASHKKYQNE
jgi:hypothetical protein